MKVQPNQRESGVGLIYVMFAAALTGVIVVTTTTMLQNQTKERVLEARKIQRVAAYEFVKASLSDPAAMRVSSLFDTNLRGCIGLRRNPATKKPLSNTQCVAGMSSATAIPKMLPFRLYVPFSKASSRIQISASSLKDPAGYYDHRGRMVPGNCSDLKKCPYQILTWYWAQCPNNTATCGEAVRIFSYAQIHQVGTLAIQTKSYIFPKESERTKSPYIKSSFILTSDIADSIYMTCPEGAVMVGTTAIEDPSKIPGAAPLNLAKCACLQGYSLDKTKGVLGYDKATNWPYCTMQLCDAKKGEVLSEIDINGDIKCKVPNADEYECKLFPTPSNGVVNCPAKHKMRGLDKGNDCTIIKDQSGKEIVSCDQMVIKCCIKK